jgi:hypothetical protein
MMQERRRQSREREGGRIAGKHSMHFSRFDMFQKFKGADINVIVRKMVYFHLYLGGCK